jgi:predicted short-subunit dehydrogenase-like oxidoreductase (DUF2520 family)
MSNTMSELRSPRLGFVGAGRLARTLAQAFARAGYAVTAVASRSRESSRSLAAALPACLALDDPQAVLEHADIVFLAVPDDSIGTIAHRLRVGSAPSGSVTDTATGTAGGTALVHCSGATSVEVLAPARAQGARIGGFHPLYLFSGSSADVDRIIGCSITIEADATLRPTLVALAEALGCHPLAISGEARLAYHGAAHYAASFAICALSEATQLWRTAGISESDGLRALLPMLAGTVEAAREKGLVDALSGPVSRGDAATLERQLAAFEALGGDHAALYALLTRRAVALARRRAHPPPSIDSIDALVEATLARAGAPGASAK